MQAQLEQKSSVSSSSVELLAIPPDGVDRVWPIVVPFLQKAADTTEKLTVDDTLLAMCRSSLTHLWVIVDVDEMETLAVLLTDVQESYNGHRAGRVIAAGGLEMTRWTHVIRQLEDWAIQNECDSFEIVGRKGWGRVFPEYDLIECVYAKELPNG